MDRVIQVQDLSMDWCINCHRTTEVQSFDSKFYVRYEEKDEKLKNGEVTKITVNMVGGSVCQK